MARSRILLALVVACLLLMTASEPVRAGGAVGGSAVEVVQTTAGLSQHLTRLPDLGLIAPSDVCVPSELRMAAGPKYTAAHCQLEWAVVQLRARATRDRDVQVERTLVAACHRLAAGRQSLDQIRRDDRPGSRAKPVARCR